MRFFGPDNQIVWDGERGKALCRFEGGVLETDDERTISLLTSLGYESEGQPEPENTETASGREVPEPEPEPEPGKATKRGRPKKE